jgi:hypothetical protein
VEKLEKKKANARLLRHTLGSASDMVITGKLTFGNNFVTQSIRTSTNPHNVSPTPTFKRTGASVGPSSSAHHKRIGDVATVLGTKGIQNLNRSQATFFTAEGHSTEAQERHLLDQLHHHQFQSQHHQPLRIFILMQNLQIRR